jgi:hypothetical protein
MIANGHMADTIAMANPAAVTAASLEVESDRAPSFMSALMTVAA